MPNLTIEQLFSEPRIVRAVIDRTMSQIGDTINWKRYLDYQQTRERAYKTYLGNATFVVAGTIIGENGNKPLRTRKNMGSGLGEVASLGDSYQMGNDRLVILRDLVNVYNAKGQSEQINDIVNFLVDDYRQALLAPHKRMDALVGQARSEGIMKVDQSINPQGVEVEEIVLPVRKYTASKDDLGHIITYLQDEIVDVEGDRGNFFTVMEMTRKTFRSKFIKSKEFVDTYKLKLDGFDYANHNLITTDKANELLEAVEFPARIRLVDERVALPDGTTVKAFSDNKITLLPQDKIGKMMWYKPYEMDDKVAGKTYNDVEGGKMYIASERTNEGRFLEYGAEWGPSIEMPHKMAIIDVSVELGE